MSEEHGLRHEHKLRIFENRMLRRIFGPMRDEVVGGWGQLHNKELHNLYSSRNIIKIIKSRTVIWVRECNTHREVEFM
jgi:hypothetical protein